MRGGHLHPGSCPRLAPSPAPTSRRLSPPRRGSCGSGCRSCRRWGGGGGGWGIIRVSVRSEAAGWGGKARIVVTGRWAGQGAAAAAGAGPAAAKCWRALLAHPLPHSPGALPLPRAVHPGPSAAASHALQKKAKSAKTRTQPHQIAHPVMRLEEPLFSTMPWCPLSTLPGLNRGRVVLTVTSAGEGVLQRIQGMPSARAGRDQALRCRHGTDSRQSQNIARRTRRLAQSR